eukprot:7883778-Lingulodinium_polyedra.AAC.1
MKLIVNRCTRCRRKVPCQCTRTGMPRVPVLRPRGALPPVSPTPRPPRSPPWSGSAVPQRLGLGPAPGARQSDW